MCAQCSGATKFRTLSLTYEIYEIKSRMDIFAITVIHKAHLLGEVRKEGSHKLMHSLGNLHLEKSDKKKTWKTICTMTLSGTSNTLPDHSWIKLYVNIPMDLSGGLRNKLWGVIHKRTATKKPLHWSTTLDKKRNHPRDSRREERCSTCDIMLDQARSRRAKVADSRGSDLPCADRAWSSMISHVEQCSSRHESRWWFFFFFLSRVVLHKKQARITNLETYFSYERRWKLTDLGQVYWHQIANLHSLQRIWRP